MVKNLFVGVSRDAQRRTSGICSQSKSSRIKRALAQQESGPRDQTPIGRATVKLAERWLLLL